MAQGRDNDIIAAAVSIVELREVANVLKLKVEPGVHYEVSAPYTHRGIMCETLPIQQPYSEANTCWRRRL